MPLPVAIMALVLVFAGLGSSGLLSPQTALADGQLRVDIEEDGYQPAAVAVQPGAVVRWRNKEKSPRTVTSDAGAFESGILAKGQEFSHTFTVPGTYPYHDRYSSFRGVVTVAGSPAAPAQSEPPAPAPPAPQTPSTGPAPSPAPAPQSSAPSTGAVAVVDNSFSPARLSVAVGATVAWTNSGKKPHTVTSSAGGWDSGTLQPGQRYSRTFDQPGTYSFVCLFHDGMAGTLVVSGGGAAPPAASVPPAPAAPAPPPPAAASPPSPAPAPAPAGAPQGAAAATSVDLGDNFFTPAEPAVPAGGTLAWTNTGRRPHTVTSAAGDWDSGILQPGQSFSRTFTAPGTYPFLCSLHDGMTGTVTVGAAVPGAAPAPAPAPAPTGAQEPNGAAPAPPPAPASPAAPARSGSAAMNLGDNFFSPGQVSIPVGGAIQWVNTGRRMHTVTAVAGDWDSGIMQPGGSFSWTFNVAGSYPFLCALHPEMTGTVVVGSGGGPAAAPAPDAPANQPAPPAAAAAPSQPGVAPGPSGSPSPGSASAAAGSVGMGDSFFSPTELTVSAGATVSWSNGGRLPHTVTSKDGSFSSPLLKAGEAFQHRFDSPGTYDYLCAVHPEMTGRVVVMATAGAGSGRQAQGTVADSTASSSEAAGVEAPSAEAPRAQGPEASRVPDLPGAKIVGTSGRAGPATGLPAGPAANQGVLDGRLLVGALGAMGALTLLVLAGIVWHSWRLGQMDSANRGQ